MSEEESEKITLDLSKKCLKKVPKEDDAHNVKILLLDDNELQKIDNIDAYLKIEKLSLSKNQLLRMYGVCRLHSLRELNLSYNGILTIEGLKELVHLQRLNLEGNNIKTIEHLNTNTKLEYLNLSENSIGCISDISFLKCLKELYLHGNRITHLRQCDKYLPMSLEVLTLAKNNISDLNEICTLSNLCNLHKISINDNPCVQMTGRSDGFDHRPFVLNWCMSVRVIDGFVVDPIESLKAEWLYSQGRGRQFRVGDQEALAKYLSSVCPLLGKALESDNERKLRLILSKAQQHQRQLQEEISENSNNSTGNNSPSSGRKKTTSRIQSPRFSRLSGRQGSPDSMSNSYHGNTSGSVVSNDSLSNTNHLLQMTTSLIENIKNDSLMSQSFDGTISYNSNSGVNSVSGNHHHPHSRTYSNSSQESTSRTITPNQYNEQQQINSNTGGPLTTASKMVPVPESLMSPDCCPATVAQRVTVSSLSSAVSQNQTGNIRSNKSKIDSKSGSPKITRSPHLKRSNEKSPHSSPRKINHNLSNSQVAALKSCLVDNNQQNNSSKSSSRLTSSCIEVTPIGSGGSGTISSDDDSDHINVDKLKTIRNKAAQRSQQRKENVDISSVNINKETETSAILIQKIWRGYRTRKKTKNIAEKLLKKRTQEYIEKLTKDMEITKAQLENERKIQQLQMQAINALWKKVSSMQPNLNNQTVCNQDTTSTSQDNNNSNSSAKTTITLDNSSTAIVNDLAKTCSMLTNQVQQLQGSMRDILNCMTIFCNLPQENLKKAFNNQIENMNNEYCYKKDTAATQTEIIAVHTPQIDNQQFPFSKIRPSSLPLDTTSSSSNTIIGGDGLQQQQQQQKSNQKDVEVKKDSEEKIQNFEKGDNYEKNNEQQQQEENKLNAENLIHSSSTNSKVVV